MTKRKNETHEEWLGRIREYERTRRGHKPQEGEIQSDELIELRLKHNARQLAWYHANRDKVLQRRKDLALRPGQRDKFLDQRRVQGKNSRVRIRQQALDAYGNRCACCGETTNEFLTIDHANGDGNKHFDPRYGGKKRLCGIGLYHWLKDNGYPPGFRVLCYNCNCAIGHYGKCPHQP